MKLPYTNDKEFCLRLTEIHEANLDNENFGVDELVKQTGLTPMIKFNSWRGMKNRTRTITLFISAIILLATGLVMFSQMGIHYKMYAYSLIIGGMSCFIYSLVNIWRSPQSFARLFIAGQGIIVMLLLTYAILSTVNAIDFSIIAIGIVTLILVYLPCTIVGILGFILRSIQKIYREY